MHQGQVDENHKGPNDYHVSHVYTREWGQAPLFDVGALISKGEMVLEVPR